MWSLLYLVARALARLLVSGVTLAGGGTVPSGFTASPLIEINKANVSQYQ
jgi:hypothetical protein